MEKVITTLPDSYASVQSFRPGHHFLTQKLRSVLGNGSYYLQSEKKNLHFRQAKIICKYLIILV